MATVKGAGVGALTLAGVQGGDGTQPRGTVISPAQWSAEEAALESPVGEDSKQRAVWLRHQPGALGGVNWTSHEATEGAASGAAAVGAASGVSTTTAASGAHLARG